MTGKLTRGVMWDLKVSLYLKRRPGRAFARFLAGWVSLIWGGARDAERYFDEALGIDAGCSLARIGKLCALICRRRYRKAALTLERESAKIVHGKVDQFRLGSAISQCALLLLRAESAHGRRGRARDAALRLADAFGGAVKKPVSPRKDKAASANGSAVRADAGSAKDPDDSADSTEQALRLIRYVELVCRDAERDRGRGHVGGIGVGGGTQIGAEAPQIGAERRELARVLCKMPGVLDEFRLMMIRDAREGGLAGADCRVFTLDEPAALPSDFLNRAFRQMVFAGDFRGAGAMLAHLNADGSQERITRPNQWLYLKLCLGAGAGDADA
ncbi:MAG: hypothetical protein LBU58_06895, partial [Clostridiales bacterium]|nr:hypothetical protein [Clostridiales bacterium]